MYRRENSAVRSIPDPVYFSETPEFPEDKLPALDCFQFEKDKEIFETIKQDVEEVPDLYDLALESLSELKVANAERTQSVLIKIESKARERISNLDAV